MVKFVGVEDVRKLVQKEGLESFIKGLILQLKKDFSNWESFEKSARHAIYSPEGVIELMPVASTEIYTYKYVNGHLLNAAKGLMSVVAYGALAKRETGYTLMLSEMTLLTAIRTAATCAIAAEYLAKPNSKKLGIVGCGSQSEFQVIAYIEHLGIEEVYYYDIDPKAMAKFAKNMTTNKVKLIATSSVEDILKHKVDILTLCTQNLDKSGVLKGGLYAGLFINAMGGDSEVKYEMTKSAVDACTKIVVEYFPQSAEEGEIKYYNEAEAKERVYAELWELIAGKKTGRENDDEIILYDSVGFALEDYSVLTYVYDKIKNDSSIKDIDLIPDLDDVKNLYSLID